MIRGIDVTLYTQKQDGTDAFNKPIWTEKAVTVSNVLVGEPSTDEITDATDLYGKKLLCWLALPKGDANDWKDKRVEWTEPSGRTFKVRTFGFPVSGIEANVPGPWHVKIRCEAYGD